MPFSFHSRSPRYRTALLSCLVFLILFFLFGIFSEAGPRRIKAVRTDGTRVRLDADSAYIVILYTPWNCINCFPEMEEFLSREFSDRNRFTLSRYSPVFSMRKNTVTRLTNLMPYTSRHYFNKAAWRRKNPSRTLRTSQFEKSPALILLRPGRPLVYLPYEEVYRDTLGIRPGLKEKILDILK